LDTIRDHLDGVGPGVGRKGGAHDPASLVQVSYWLIALVLCAAPGRPVHPSLGGGGKEGAHIGL